MEMSEVRLIDANQAIKEIRHLCELLPAGMLPVQVVRLAAEKFLGSDNWTPTVDPCRHGVWQVIQDGGKRYLCSRCAAVGRADYNYCPICGSENALQEAD